MTGIAPAPAGGLVPPPRRRAIPGWIGELVMPVFLALVTLALYLWVQAQELDSIEARSLNSERIRELLVEHVLLTVYATVLIIAIAVPLGVALTRTMFRRAVGPVVGVANIGQAVPSIGLLVLLAIYVDIGTRTAVVALVLYGLLPVLRNTMVGLDQVDRSLVEAARGMGMGQLRVLWTVELPLAVPVMLAGIRTALVLAVGTATLATFINAGGLGDLINNGIKLDRTPVLVTGSVLTAVLALAIDWLAGVAERVLRPRGI